MRIKVLAMLLSGLTVAACGQQSESSGTDVAAGQANDSASSGLSIFASTLFWHIGRIAIGTPAQPLDNLMERNIITTYTPIYGD